MVIRDIVLVTGGMGYIGQHVVTELLMRGERVHIIDNLSRCQSGDIDVFQRICITTEQKKNIQKLIPVTLHEYDITDHNLINHWFLEFGERTKLIIHLAALKSVPESIDHPDMYYTTNTHATEFLVEIALTFKVPKFVFSSTACVYGGICPSKGYTEDMASPVNNCTNPYGNSKRLSEVYMELLNSRNITTVFVALRYFNPVGCHPSGLIGENYNNNKQTNLFPIIWSVVNRKRNHLSIYGNNYPSTNDGTPARDFIEISDLVNAHLVFLDKTPKLRPGYHCFNVGTGKSTSVMEFLKLFENVLGINIPYKLSERREGDQELSLACTDKITSIFGWKSTSDLSYAIINADKRNLLLNNGNI